MTTPEPPLPVADDDELDAAASAVVDGVASHQEAALVGSSPRGRARVEALRAVAAAVGRPVPEQRPAAAASAMAAALSAYAADEHESEPGYEATVLAFAPPVSVVAVRWLPRVGAVAAALVLLLGIGALAAGLIQGGREDAQQSSRPEARFEEPAAERRSIPADASRDAGAPQGQAAAPPPAAAPGATAGGTATTDRPAPPVVDGGDFGSEADVQSLVQRAAAALDSPTDSSTAQPTALPRDLQACVDAAPATAGEPVGALRYRAVGSFQGTPAVVLAHERPGGTPARLLLVLAREGCTLLTASRF